MPKDSKLKQSYRTAWESLPDFKGCLQPVPGEPTRAFCNVCQKTLYAHRFSLLQHTCTSKHTKLAQMKFIEDEKQKKHSEPPKTVTSVDILSPEIMDSNIDFKRLEDAVINSSEDEAASLYINSMSQPQPKPSVVLKTDTIGGSPPISTHVLDTTRGLPVQNLQVSLYKLENGRWTLINECVTNPDGRCSEFISREDFKAGRFKLHFDVDKYFELRKLETIYPFIEIVFDVHSPQKHYHIPLIISPFGFSTYKGS